MFQKPKRKRTRQNAEKIVYSITADVQKANKCRNGDWKIKLTDGNDKYINYESPNMGANTSKNPYSSQKFSLPEVGLKQTLIAL